MAGIARQPSGYTFPEATTHRGYIADFYCHSAALVVEVDGSPHQRQAGYNRLRDQTFATLGIRTLRFTNMEIRKNLDLVLTTIGSAVRIT